MMPVPIRFVEKVGHYTQLRGIAEISLAQTGAWDLAEVCVVSFRGVPGISQRSCGAFECSSRSTDPGAGHPPDRPAILYRSP